MRLLDKSGEMWGTMTPLKGLTFVYDLIYLNKNNDKNVWCIFMEWADNPYLLADEVEELAKNMSADELESRRYGRFKFYNGLVYGEFDENVNVIEPFELPTHWQDMISIDPGLNNPLSAHWYAVDGDGAVYVVAEHYEAGKDIQYHCGRIKDICRRLNWKTDYRGRISCLMDCAANQRTLNGLKSVSELFLEQDIAVNTRVNKEIFSGISRVKKYLKPIGMPPKLYIFKGCVN
jgi:phage terminase large subunit